MRGAVAMNAALAGGKLGLGRCLLTRGMVAGAPCGAEVDLLPERDGVFHPIDIKLASRPSRQDVRGI